MKEKYFTLSLMKPILFIIIFIQGAFAQGYNDPLIFQELDHNLIQSASSRAAGCITIGIQNEVGLMFSNPASLQSLKGIQVVVGNLEEFTNARQVQQYTPLKYYPNFSLLMEGLTGYLNNPDTLYPGSNPGDTVQRPYDTIGPNWSHSKNRGFPNLAYMAVPFSIFERKFIVGIGAVEYANMNHYYQNNNILSPTIGSQRPIPIPQPKDHPDSTFKTQWYQYLRSREGSIQGYGMAMSGSISDKISLGFSGMILKGSTDDYEHHIGRGRLVFYTYYFRLDSLYHRITKTGTSDFSGQEYTFSGIYRGNNVSLGFAVKPPTTITRKFTSLTNIDTTGSSLSSEVNDKDEMRIPWRGTVGLSINLLQNLTLGLEYEIRPYESAVYKSSDGTESKPWLSTSVLHVGAVYNPLPWLVLRAGLRGQAEIFDPEGNPLVDEPVRYSIYSAGCGIFISNIRLNFSYEYASMKYQDMWQTNVNLNSEKRHSIITEIAYEIP